MTGETAWPRFFFFIVQALVIRLKFVVVAIVFKRLRHRALPLVALCRKIGVFSIIHRAVRLVAFGIVLDTACCLLRSGLIGTGGAARCKVLDVWGDGQQMNIAEHT